MCQKVLRIKRGDMDPIFDSLFDITLIKEEVSSSERRVDGFLKMAGPLEELGELFHGHGISGRDLGDALIDLQGFLIIALLVECQSQAVKSLRVVWHFL